MTPRMSNTHFDLIIQGAGPTGCVAALLAQRVGLSVLLIDKRTAETFRGNAHYLNAHSLELLSHCGLNMENILTHATPSDYAFAMAYCSSLDHVYHHTNLFTDPDIKQRYQHTGRFGGAQNIPFSTVYRALLAELEQQGTPICWQTEITDIDLATNTLHACDHDDHISPYHFRFLIGSDGVNSGIRAQLFSQPNKTTHMNFVNIHLNTDFTRLITTPALLYWILNPSYPGCLVLHQLKGQQNLQIPLFDAADQPTPSREWATRYINGILGKGRFDGEIERIERWSVSTFVAPQFHHDNVFLVGDSAHGFTPAGGLGLNCALADAANLIWKLAAVQRGANATRYLHSYQEERMPVASQGVRQSVANLIDFQSIPNHVGLPVTLATPWRTLTQQLPSPIKKPLNEGISCLYEGALRGAFGLPIIRDTLTQSLNTAMKDTWRHFDGMDSHLGWHYHRGLIQVDSSVIDSQPNTFSSQPTTGCLWFCDRLRVRKTGKSLRAQFRYGRWMAIMQEGQAIKWPPFVSVDTYFIGVDCVPVDTDTKNAFPPLLLIRPDGIIAYQGPGETEAINAILSA